MLRYSINRIQIKDHRERSYEINKISLFYFNGKHIFKTMDVMDQRLVVRVN